MSSSSRRPIVIASVLASCAALLTASACRPTEDSPEARKVAAQKASKKRTPKADPNRVARPRFENPGGMWMPTQMPEHEAQLKELGLNFDAKKLTDPSAMPLGAVVSLGGCSASFVSEQGLLVTNHHCATGALQHNSTPDDNLIANGYLAADQAAEKSVGPTGRVYVTTAFTDVSEKIKAGLDAIDDAKARYDEIDKRRKELVRTCEDGKDNVRCSVASYFEGAEYYQIEQLELRDVRLVYAPKDGVGVYGGEIDNWRWPRHTGDYTFLRAYVGKDGKPADYAEDNVPYQPPHHLEVNPKGVAQNDLVMVAGYPGRTSRLKTADEVAEATEWYYPRAVARYEQMLATINETIKDDKELEIKANSMIRGLGNALTNNKGMLDGLAKGGLAAQRREDEVRFKAWINGTAERKKSYGGVLEGIAKLNAEQRSTRDRDAALSELTRGSTLLRWAIMLHDIADERPKPDAERDASYQERNWARTKQGIEASARRYDRKLDRALFKLAIERSIDLPEKDRPALLTAIFGETAIDKANVEAVLDRFYADSKLEDPAWVAEQFDRATKPQLAKSKDPMIALGAVAKAAVDEQDDRDEAHAGAMALLRPKYVAALREFKKGSLAPDANSTLRITYGTVRGYRPSVDKPMYRPFTTLSEMVAKHKDEEPFDAPDEVLAAAKAKEFGPYVHPKLGEVPLNFLADLDTTGGNSGSAALDRDGKLIGLLFDGNYESMASDWIFMPDITRSILVDIRYVLWLADAVDGAHHILKEMGVQPAFADNTDKPGQKSADGDAPAVSQAGADSTNAG